MTDLKGLLDELKKIGSPNSKEMDRFAKALADFEAEEEAGHSPDVDRYAAQASDNEAARKLFRKLTGGRRNLIKDLHKLHERAVGQPADTNVP